MSGESTEQQASTSLWIGNVDPSVTEDTLVGMFSSYGQLANVRCLPEKYCAFVNFKIKEDAQKAMLNLQVGLFVVEKFINHLKNQLFLIGNRESI